MTIPLTWRYFLAFFCLGTVLGIAHEFAHHFAGLLICGQWGYKTFNSFELAAGCAARQGSTVFLATLAGPLFFNYIPMWVGFFRLRRPDAGEKLLGFSLVLASVPLLRIVPNLYWSNDEAWIVTNLFGRSHATFWAMNALIWLIAVPPLVAAWRAVTNRWRVPVYLLFLVVVPGAVAALFGGVLEPLILEKRVLVGTLMGIPYLVWLAEVLATFGYWKLKAELRAAAP